MLITNQFVTEHTISPDGLIRVETFRAGKRGVDAFQKRYLVKPEFFTDELLKEIHGEPSFYGPTNKICGIRLWLDGDSYLTFYITKKQREKYDKLLYKEEKSCINHNLN